MASPAFEDGVLAAKLTMQALIDHGSVMSAGEHGECLAGAIAELLDTDLQSDRLDGFCAELVLWLHPVVRGGEAGTGGPVYGA